MTVEPPDAIYSTLGADPDLGELVEMFVDEMPHRIATLTSAREANDRELVQRTAHQLKGTAGSYGFDQITSYVARLEASLREQKPEDEIEEALEAVVLMCGRVRAGAPD